MRLKTYFGKALISLFLLLSLNMAYASTRIFIGFGPIEPHYYGPPPVVYVPSHWYRGLWVPGQYVQYRTPIYYGAPQAFFWQGSSWHSKRHHYYY